MYFTSRTEFVGFGVGRTPGEDLLEDDSSCVDVSLLGARLPSPQELWGQPELTWGTSIVFNDGL